MATFALKMLTFFEENFFSQRKKQLRHKHHVDRRGRDRPSCGGFGRRDGLMASASPVLPFEGDGNPNPTSNRRIPHESRLLYSPRHHITSIFKDGDADYSDAGAFSRRKRYRCDSHPLSRYTDYYENNDNFVRERPPPPLAHAKMNTNSYVRDEQVTLPPRSPAPTAKFAELSRHFFRVIKLCHHLDNVTPTDGNRIPPFLIRHITHQLCAVLKPAFPNFTILSVIKDNAQQWGSSTLGALEQHYSSLLTELLSEVALSLPRDWSSPFLVASRWAKRNFPRIHQTTLDRAKRLIESQAPELQRQMDQHAADLPHPPSTVDPPARPSGTTSPRPIVASHPEPVPGPPHQVPLPLSSSPRAPVSPHRRKGQRSLPSRAPRTPLRKPQPSERQDSSAQDDLTPGDDERQSPPALPIRKPHRNNLHPPTESRDTGQQIPIHPAGSDTAADDDDYDYEEDGESYDEAEEFLDSHDELPTQTGDQLKLTLLHQRFVTPTYRTKTHTKLKYSPDAAPFEPKTLTT